MTNGLPEGAAASGDYATGIGDATASGEREAGIAAAEGAYIAGLGTKGVIDAVRARLSGAAVPHGRASGAHAAEPARPAVAGVAVHDASDLTGKHNVELSGDPLAGRPTPTQG